jgi:hypothetical protein
LPARRMRDFSSHSLRYLVRRNYVNGASCAIRRSDIDGALPTPEGVPHDYWLAIWCSLKNGIAGIPVPLYRYRQHGSNVIGLGSSRLLYRLLGIWRQPTTPRQRELHMMWDIIRRLEELGIRPTPAILREKCEWLRNVLDDECTSVVRLGRILSSIVSGSYSRYSPHLAYLRDLASLLRRPKR